MNSLNPREALIDANGKPTPRFVALWEAEMAPIRAMMAALQPRDQSNAASALQAALNGAAT